MDEHVQLFLDCRKEELSGGNYNVLRFIRRHSLKTPGLSYAKVATIAEAAPFLPLPDIEKGWNKVLQVYGRMNALEQLVEEYITLLVPVWKQVIYAYKMGKVRAGLFAYFHGALEKVFTRQLRREAHRNSDLLFYDWLEEEEDAICVSL